MNMISLEEISKTYGEKELFRSISFQINEKDRVGLIGVNGTGKTSLLQIVSGEEEADSGNIVHPNDYRIGYLKQQPEFDPELTVMEQVFNGDSPLITLINDYEKVLAQYEKDSSDATVQDSLIDIQKRMDAANGWEVHAQAKSMLTKLGITQFDQQMSALSGGQKKRVSLAQVLLDSPDLLILDEPTNHLDFESIVWLEEFLSKYPHAVLLVTHDRYFLDHVVNHILELDGGNIYKHRGNYQQFLEQKAKREEDVASTEDKKRNLFRKELAWIRRGAKARSTKQKARIQRFEQLESSLTNQNKSEMDMNVGSERLGKQVFEFKDAYKSFGEKKILEAFNLLIKPKDRIGIIGVNGSGKSTLMNIIAEKASLDSGSLKIGQTVKIAFYQQENEDIDLSKRMIEYVREEGEVITTDKGETISVTQMLERFLFPAHTHGTPIRKLSGGEKRRLYLLKLLMGKPNVLLLDEPTNDLDTQTLTILEDYLEEFPGVVISVSHDRYFLDKTATQLLVFKGNANIESYYGIYTEYLEDLQREQKQQALDKKADTSPKEQAPPEKKEKTRLSYMEKREWEEIDDKITFCESEIERLNAALANVGSDFTEAQQLMSQLDEQNQLLETLIERWSYLSEYAE